MRIAFLILTLAAALSAQGTPSRKPLPVPKIKGFETLKCDFHMHTVFSDGVVWPDTRVKEAWRDGMDAIAITDHDDYHPHRATVSVDLSQPHALAKPAADQLGLLLVPGIEVTKGDLHVNALFVKNFNATANLGLLESLRLMKQEGAFFFWNHPGWKGNKSWYPEIDQAHREGLIHGVEVVNSDLLEPQTLPWLEEKKLTILANTDVHELVEVPAGKHRSPVTLVLARTRDLDGIREALQSRRTIAWRQDECWGSGEWLNGLFESSITMPAPVVLTRDGGAVLRMRNASAIPFHLRMVKGPEWMRLEDGGEPHLAAESESAIRFSVARNRPPGRQRVEIEWEALNLHIPMAGNARVRTVFELD